MTTASFKHAAGDSPAYRRWQFATLSEPVPEPEPVEPEQPMVSAAEIEAIRSAAHAEGYGHGFGAGRTDGKAAADAEVEHLKRLGQSISRARVELSEETARALLALAVDIAQHVLRAELQHNPAAMLAAVRETIDLAGRGGNPQLLLNPGDVDFVRRHLGEDLAAENWRLSEDARIEPGGCRAVTASGAIDATLATRWARATAALGTAAPAVQDGLAEPVPVVQDDGPGEPVADTQRGPDDGN